jgi:hypothetical protein
VTVNDGLTDPDPTDLIDLRRTLSASDPEGWLSPVGTKRVEIAPAPYAFWHSTPKRHDGAYLMNPGQHLLTGCFAV